MSLAEVQTIGITKMFFKQTYVSADKNLFIFQSLNKVWTRIIKMYLTTLRTFFFLWLSIIKLKFWEWINVKYNYLSDLLKYGGIFFRKNWQMHPEMKKISFGKRMTANLAGGFLSPSSWTFQKRIFFSLTERWWTFGFDFATYIFQKDYNSKQNGCFLIFGNCKFFCCLF